MKSFLEMRQTTPDLYPATIPMDLQQVINDWFDFREVCSDAKFKHFFQRQLLQDYPQYEQLLRIQPGVKGEYDWFIGEYAERRIEVEHMLQTNQKTESNNTTTNNSKGTTSTTDVQEHDNAVTSETAQNVAHTGTDNATRTDDLTQGITGNSTTTYGKSNTTQNTGKDSNTTIGSDTSVQNTGNNGQNAMQQMPMSAEGLIHENKNQNEAPNPAIDNADINWSTATSAGETWNRGYQDSKGSNSSTTTGENSGSTTSTDSGQDAITNSTTQNNSGTQQNNRTVDLNDALTGNGTTKDKGTTSGTGSSNFNNEDTGIATNTGSNDTSTAGSSDTKEIMSGRHEPPADILRRAQSYIKTSNAWFWLYGRLDALFISVYEV